ncbi:MAG: radical SAM protein [Phycisphaerae bacterium]|nr:radical SAM protein [Phycisphaerae bacterium]
MTSPLARKWRLFRAWASRHPVWCSWQVTYRCNFRCGFCQYWRDPMGELPEQSVEQFEEGSRKLASLGTLMVSLAGGEPLIRPDLPDVVRAVAKWHFPFITTHGWFVTEQLAADLFDAGLWGASVSIDYIDPKMHDKARGMTGAFDRAVRALEHFRKARRHKWQRVNVMSVLLHNNLDQIEDLIKLAAQHEAYFTVQPYCNRKTNSDRFRCEDASDGSVSARLLELRKKHPNFLSNPVFLGRFDQYLDGGVPGCRAGRAFFNIDSIGDVAICVEQRTAPVANLYEHSARQIIERLRTGSTGNTCADCWYNCRGETESLYAPSSLIRSLPTYLFDNGKPRRSACAE